MGMGKGILILLVVAVTGGSVVVEGRSRNRLRSNENPVFQEEFNGNLLRKDLWDIDETCAVNGPPTPELECFRNDWTNLEVSNGTLKIRAKLWEYRGKAFTSGRIRLSRPGYNFGTFVVSAKLPKGRHLIPTISLVPVIPDPCKFEEIDIVQARGQRSSSLIMGAHYGRDSSHVLTRSKEKVFRNVDFSRDFHEFAVKWTPTNLAWYVDGTKVHEITTYYLSDWIKYDRSNLPCTSEMSPFVRESQVVLGLSVGGPKFRGDGIEVSSGEAHEWESPVFEVDSVRIYGSIY